MTKELKADLLDEMFARTEVRSTVICTRARYGAERLLRHLATRMYFPDEPEANLADPVLALVSDPDARETLIARDDGGVLRFDIRLQGERETVFFAF